MQKYAFVVNAPGLTAEHYQEFFDDGEWLSELTAKDGVDVCMDYVKGLIADGYSMINLCGDFGPEHVEELMKDAPEGTIVRFAGYFPEEQAKLEALDEYVEYGQIIFGGVDEPVRFDLLDPAMNTHTIFIKDMEQAEEAARELAAEGMDGIELCGSFDEDMTRRIIRVVESVSKKIPVGSNGI